MNILRRFEQTRPFTEGEAWSLFRIAAVAEAVGWTILIIGIVINRYLAPHSSSVLILAGRIHGMLFFAYCLASAGLYPSLGWSRWRGLWALAWSIPPYGTLLFEYWVSVKRHNSGFKTYHGFLCYMVLTTEI